MPVIQVEAPPVFQVSAFCQVSLPGSPGRRNGVGLPGGLAGLGIERFDEAANAELAARHADEHLALHDQRRHRHVVTVLPVLDLRLPGHLAGLGVQRHQRRVQARQEHLVAVQRHAAAGVVQRCKAFRQFALVSPHELAGGCVERDHLAVGSGDEHHAVVDDRRRFVPGSTPVETLHTGVRFLTLPALIWSSGL